MTQLISIDRDAAPSPATPLRVALFGATGTIGRAAAAALAARGHAVTCPVRAGSDGAGLPAGVRSAPLDWNDAGGLAAALSGVDAVVSCMASRTGAPEDAWAVDFHAQMDVLAAARAAGVGRFVLLSAICVQKPRLAFQHAKLAFEAALGASGLSWSIVRPTAYFKSLSGQIARVRRGRPFLIFGGGRLTATKPIGDADLAEYLADCLHDPARWNRVLPIGGPGPATTPYEQGEMLFAALGKRPRFRRVPVAVLDWVAGGLGAAGRIAPPLAAKAELARIGRYYATESMLVWDAAAGRYDAEATPEWGTQTLADHYRRVAAGEATVALGAHAVF